MLTLKKVKELVEAPSHAKRTPSPKMLFEEGIVLLRREFDQGSHLTVYNSGYVLFSAGKRNTVFHIHDCCGDYAYDAAEGKGDVIEEEYFENCEWHIRALFEGERKMEDNQAKCEGAGRSNVCVSYHALSEDWSEIADRTINMLEKIIENGTFFRMLESIDKNASTLDEKRLAQIYQNTIGAAFDEIKALLPADGIGIYSSTWLTAKLIEQDKLARSLVKETVDAGTYTAIEKKLSDVKDGNLLTGDCKFQWIDKLVNENVTSKKNKLLRSRFDKAATSKRWGKPIAIGMIVLGLICSMVIGFPLMGLFSGLISAISVPLANWLLDIGAAPFLVSLLCNAILTAVSFALQMASYVFGISLVFGLMEDVGYMARISYVFDDTMTKLGLQGKAIMPFLVSFGCNIGGITGTRVIDSWGQRVMTIALSWVVPCASTWGVVGLVSGTFFGNGAVVVVLALFAVAFLHIFITYKVFGRSLNKVEGRTGLIMELPPYHKPHWKSLFGSVFSKMGNVLSRALRIIICISVIFWLLSYSADGNVANSIIYKVGTFIEPVTSLFGLPWQLFIAFVASAMGKEASLGVMASLFNTGSIWAAIEQSATVDTAALSTSMLSVISRPEALAFLFAFFFNMPCLMALTATTQETHSMKWTVRIALYYVLTALIMATIAYHVGLVIF